MIGTDLLPLMILAAVPIAALFQLALFRSSPLALVLSLIGYGLAALLFSLFISNPPQHITPLLIIDSYGCFYAALINAAAMAIALISYSYVQKQEEYYLFLSLATLGATVLTLTTHFAAFFLGLETMTIALYTLIGFTKTEFRGIEGAIKYLILAGLSSAFLLFGLAMLYLHTGTLAFTPLSSSPFVLGALAMILVGIGFKLAVAPFYLWTPDVYQGAPAPVTAFIATISKGAVFVFFVRSFASVYLPGLPVLMAMAITSMVVGNLLALFQDNLKRLLAYSSIAHIGYLLVAYISEGVYAYQAIAFYLTAYFITTLGAFGSITLLSNEKGEAELLSSYRGLAWRRPMVACILALMLFSLAGLPLTAGFIGKFYILRAAISSTLWLPVLILILTSILGLFYYLRVIVTLFAPEGQSRPVVGSLSCTLTLIALTLLLLWLGVYPELFIVRLSFCRILCFS